MNLDLYRQASELEDTNPEEALKIYKRLEHENKEFHMDILLVAIICPIIAFVIAFLVVQYIGSYRTISAIASILILILVGFTPPSLMFNIKFKEKIMERDIKYKGGIPARWLILFSSLGMALITIFSEVIEIVAIAVVAGLIAIVILFPISLVDHFLTGSPILWYGSEYPIYAIIIVFICLVIVFLFALSEIRINPATLILPHPFISRRRFIKEILKEIPIGLKINSVRILGFVIFAIGIFLVGSGSLGMQYGDIRYGFIATCISGVFFGLTFAFGPLEKDYILGNLYRIGRARCLIRLDRQAEANYRLYMMRDLSPQFGRPPVIENLTSALVELRVDAPASHAYVKEKLNEAAISISDRQYYNAEYTEIYVDSIQKTRQLAGLDDDMDIKKMIPSVPPHVLDPYFGIGCILKTGYSYQEGIDPSVYDPDNSTGYLTGQWIDVEVLEGKMYFNRWYGKGKIIRGVWSYGGDVGIVGKPKVGDLVGYYEEGYCKIWEKLQDTRTI